MHPSVILSLWLLVVLLAQVLPLAGLVFASLLGFCACGAASRTHFLHLLKRSRWILLTLLLTFLLLTPGERVWADYPLSKEGLSSGVEHLMRLVSVLLAVAWLLGGRSDEWLLSALWGLLSPLHPRHCKTLVVRLALTLRYSAGHRKDRAWRSMLAAADLPADAALVASIELPHLALSRFERCLSSGFIIAGALSLWGLS